jgi:hypothetical protein|tara:strand:+ start:69 stop:551 length:483 start_codon:yes stop_codon:yes gene_type:complete
MGEYYMAKSSLYAAHRAAGASSGRYKASLYDIANVGYAMEADIGMEQFKQGQTQEMFSTIGEALSLASSVVGGIESKKKHEELQKLYGVEPSKTSKPSKTKTTKKVPTLGSKENPYSLSETGTKAVGEAFRQAKESGVEIGSTIWGKVDDELKSWKYEYK